MTLYEPPRELQPLFNQFDRMQKRVDPAADSKGLEEAVDTIVDLYRAACNQTKDVETIRDELKTALRIFARFTSQPE